jgi:hypothetical protein
MRNPLPNPFIVEDVPIFELDSDAFLAAVVPDMPEDAIDNGNPPIDPEQHHTTTAPEIESFDLERLSMLAWVPKERR